MAMTPALAVVEREGSSLERVWVSAGRRGLQLGIAPAELVRLTRAVLAPIAR